MATQKKESSERPDSQEIIARVLAMIAVKGLEKEDAARRLLSIGFDSPDIGNILGVNPNFANAAKSRAKKRGTE